MIKCREPVWTELSPPAWVRRAHPARCIVSPLSSQAGAIKPAISDPHLKVWCLILRLKYADHRMYSEQVKTPWNCEIGIRISWTPSATIGPPPPIHCWSCCITVCRPRSFFSSKANAPVPSPLCSPAVLTVLLGWTDSPSLLIAPTLSEYLPDHN